MLRTLLACCLLLASPLLSAWELTPYTATYRFNLDNKLSGTATRVLEPREGDAWRYRFAATTAMASATETSDFRFNGRTVTPQRYEKRHKVLMLGRKSSVTFNWQTRQARGQRDDRATSYALRPGSVDPLNFEIQLRRDLMDLGRLGGPYILADAKRAEEQKFVIEGEEELETPLGKLATLRVKRVHDDAERQTVFWLAKRFDYLPARVEQHDEGALYTIDLLSYQPVTAPASGETSDAQK